MHYRNGLLGAVATRALKLFPISLGHVLGERALDGARRLSEWAARILSRLLGQLETTAGMI